MGESAKNVCECVEELAGCIFVQNVEAPALAVMTPVLVRGLNERTETTKRRCCVIVDNMCKLIDDAREGTPLMAEVRSLVFKCTESISDPDARELSVKAKNPANAGDAFKIFGFNAKAVEALVTEMANMGAAEEEEFVDEDATAPDLYKGSFSLAYGTVTLLRETKLHLKKNRFYGLLGPTNCGKTTLMRAISQEKVEGFPKRDELVTIFVQHDVEEREIEPPSKEWPTGKMNIFERARVRGGHVQQYLQEGATNH